MCKMWCLYGGKMKNPLSFLTKEQKEKVEAEIKEEGYCILQSWTNRKEEQDFRVLRDTIIITPTKIIDRIKWIFKRVI